MTAALLLALCVPGGDREMPLHHRLLCPAGAGIHEPMAATAAETPPPPAQPKTVIIAVGATTRLQMTSKRPITSVQLDREGVIRVRPAVNDQTTILITGLAPGRAVLTLTDDQGATETHELGKTK